MGGEIVDQAIDRIAGTNQFDPDAVGGSQRRMNVHHVRGTRGTNVVETRVPWESNGNGLGVIPSD